MRRKRTRVNYAEQDFSDEEVQERPTKVVKMAASRVAVPGRRRVKGGLKDLPNMPLDVIFEICTHLQLQDVLNLSRTTKTFRTIFMSRSAAYIWKAATNETDGIPECPSWMSEPQHANLLFSTHCHGCLKARVREPIWDLSVRYCPNCKETKLDYNTSLYISLPPKHSIPYEVVLSDLLNYTFGSRRRRLYHRPQLEEFLEKWAAVSEATEDSSAARNQQSPTETHSPDNVVFKFYGYNGFTAEQKEFLTSWKDRVEQMRTYATECMGWSETIAKSRADVRIGNRESRLESVIEKLIELGYDEELDSIAPEYMQLTSNAHVSQPSKLTEKAWQKMQDEIVAIMENLRAQYREQKQKQAFKDRFAALSKMVAEWDSKTLPRNPLSQCIPTAGELALMPEFRELIAAPFDETVDFQPFSARMPEFVQQWQASIKAKLLEVADETLKSLDVPDGIEPLDLAVIIFHCKVCSCKLDFPSVFVHKCLRRQRGWGSEVSNDYACQISMQAGRYPWSATMLAYGQWSRNAELLLRACGRDPARTTKRDMDELNERFYKVGEPNGRKHVYSWRQAVKSADVPASQDAWKVVGSVERTKVDELEKLRQHKVIGEWQNRAIWACSLCSKCDNGITMKSAKEHMQTQHFVDNPTLDAGDFYVDPFFNEPYAIPDSITLIPDCIPMEELTLDDKKLLESSRAAYIPV